MIRSPRSASATSTARSLSGGIEMTSTSPTALASTSDGRPDSWASSAEKLPGWWFTISRSPRSSVWVTAISPFSTTIMPVPVWPTRMIAAPSG